MSRLSTKDKGIGNTISQWKMNVLCDIFMSLFTLLEKNKLAQIYKTENGFSIHLPESIWKYEPDFNTIVLRESFE